MDSSACRFLILLGRLLTAGCDLLNCLAVLSCRGSWSSGRAGASADSSASGLSADSVLPASRLHHILVPAGGWHTGQPLGVAPALASSVAGGGGVCRFGLGTQPHSGRRAHSGCNSDAKLVRVCPSNGGSTAKGRWCFNSRSLPTRRPARRRMRTMPGLSCVLARAAVELRHERNRRWDEWHKQVSGLPPAEMIKAASLAGFAGVCVDRRGYADSGDAVIDELRGGSAGLRRRFRRQLLFSLALVVQDCALHGPGQWGEQSLLLDRPCAVSGRILPLDGKNGRRAASSGTVRDALVSLAANAKRRSVDGVGGWRPTKSRCASLAKVWVSISWFARRPRAENSHSTSSCRRESTFSSSTRRRSLWGCRGCSSHGMRQT